MPRPPQPRQYVLEPHIGHVCLTAPSPTNPRWILVDRRTQETVPIDEILESVCAVPVTYNNTSRGIDCPSIISIPWTPLKICFDLGW